MKTKSTIFILAIALCVTTNSVQAQVNVQDSLALVDLYNSTDGPHWYYQNNWLTKNPVSTWQGIAVINTRVTEIDLGYVELKGSLPSSIGNLIDLRVLDLVGNELKGSIPITIGNLINLRQLFLQLNKLSGSIPSSIGHLRSLYEFDLTENELTGFIPSSIGNLHHLHNIEFSSNQLSGNLPSSIGNLLNLAILSINYNKLSGPIPSSFGNLANLTSLWLSNNALSGSVPHSLGNLANLITLNLSNNRLSGTVPSSLAKLSNLNGRHGYLDLRHNWFTFDGMELIAQTFPNAHYDQQKNISVHQNGNSLSVSVGGTLSNNTYHWFKCEGTTPLQVATIKGDSVFHPSESGKYRVVVSNSIATELKLFTGLYDYTAPKEPVIASAENSSHGYDKTNLFRAYPNPAKDILFVETNGNAIFSLLNQSGKILLTANINGKGTMNISNMSAGLYYLRNNSTQAVQKVVIAR